VNQEVSADSYEEFPLRVTISADGIVLRFESFNELADFAQRERAAWTPIDALKQVEQVIAQPLISQQHAGWQSLAQLANQAQTNREKGTRQNIASYLRRVADGTLVYSKSTVGQAILLEVDASPEVALGRLAWATRYDLRPGGNPDLNKLIRGMVDARISQLFGDKTVELQQRALADMRKDWDSRFAGTLIEQQNVREALERYMRDTKVTIDNKNKSTKRIFRYMLNRFRGMRQDHTTEMEQMRKAFQADLALRAPATYWGDRVGPNYTVAAVAGIAFAGLAALLSFILVNEGPGVLNSLRGPDGSISLGAAVILTIPALAVFWVMRLIARLIIDHLHQARDARLRELMTRTFLALMADKDAKLGTEGTLLVLQALFRPMEASVDDAPPSNLIDIMKEAAKPK